MDSLFSRHYFNQVTLHLNLHRFLRWTTGVSPGSASCVCDLCSHIWPALKGSSHLITYSAVTVLKFLVILSKVPHISFCTGLHKLCSQSFLEAFLNSPHVRRLLAILTFSFSQWSFAHPVLSDRHIINECMINVCYMNEISFWKFAVFKSRLLEFSL